VSLTPLTAPHKHHALRARVQGVHLRSERVASAAIGVGAKYRGYRSAVVRVPAKRAKCNVGAGVCQDVVLRPEPRLKIANEQLPDLAVVVNDADQRFRR
jgi:hypothetical protein